MIPFRLNLLSPEKQMSLKHLFYFQYIRHNLEIFLFLLSLIAIAFLGGRWILEQHFSNLAAQLTATAQQHTERNTRIRDVNTIVRETEKVQSHYTAWSQRFPELIATLPPGVILSQLTMERQSYSISGTATTREDLLALQAALSGLPGAGKVEIPLSQLTQKENVPFSLTVSIQP